MRNTKVFEYFLNSKYGQKVLETFNKEKKFIENPQDLIVRIMKNRIKAKTYLDIGGGTGVRTLDIMKGLGIKSVDFLEPSEKASLGFYKKAQKLGLVVNVMNSGFDDFKTSRKYDLITTVHSWYYIDLTALGKLFSLLEDSGAACIFLDSKEDTIKKIQDICESEFLDYKSNNAEDVCSFLDSLGIKYNVHKDDKIFSGMVKNGKLTKRAKTIMSLVSYRKWVDISNRTKLSVKNMLESLSKSDTYPSRRWLIVIRK